jgi:hypothetical protein
MVEHGVPPLDEPQKHDSDARTLPHCVRKQAWADERRLWLIWARYEPDRLLTAATARPTSPPARRLDGRHRREAPSQLLSPSDGQPRDLPFDRLHGVAEGRGARCGSPTNSPQDGPVQPNGRENPSPRRPARQAHDRPTQRRGPKRVKCDEAFLGRIRAGQSTHQALSARAFRGPRPRAVRRPQPPRAAESTHRSWAGPVIFIADVQRKVYGKLHEPKGGPSWARPPFGFWMGWGEGRAWTANTGRRETREAVNGTSHRTVKRTNEITHSAGEMM